MKSQNQSKIIILVVSLCFGLSVSAAVANAQERPERPPVPIADKIRENIETRLENKDLRADIENRMTKDVAQVKDRVQIIKATSTLLFKRTAENRKEVVKTMQAKTFEIRKQALVNTLKGAIRNLENIAVRIQSRISKSEESGRNMADAKNLFVEAQSILAKAKAEVSTFEALSVSYVGTSTATTTATATTTPTIDLTRPRILGDAAIKSVKSARDAMHQVVLAIARNMGLKIGVTATTTTSATTTEN